MTTKPFAPRTMKLSILTAALQELTPRDLRDADPDRAVEDWLRKDVTVAYDALKANPSRAVAVGAVKARLAAAHKKASTKVPAKA